MKKIAIIGAGNVTTHLAQAWHQAGLHIVAIYSRQQQKARDLAQRLQTKVCEDIEALPEADCYVLAVADDAISLVAQQLPAHARQAVVLHTAGSVAMNVLEGLATHFGVCYPLQTFSRAIAVNMQEVPFLVEGSDAPTTAKITELARSVSTNVRPMDSQQRQYLHLSAVFASNFVNHLYDLSTQFLTQKGIDAQLLQPLLKEVWRKQQLLTPHEAQTGPARRGDWRVVEAHLHLLKGLSPYCELYELLSKSIYQTFHE